MEEEKVESFSDVRPDEGNLHGLSVANMDAESMQRDV